MDYPISTKMMMDGSIEAQFVHTDNSVVQDPIIGVGGAGIVIEKDGFAIKIPHLLQPIEIDSNGNEFIRPLTPRPGDYDERKVCIGEIEHEKAVYRRLGPHPGILQCYELDSTAPHIKLKLMKNGDLRRYLATNNNTDRGTKLTWMTDLARVVSYIHDRRVVIGDIRPMNILVDDDLSVKMADFGGSEIMPPDWNLEGITGQGYSVPMDLADFGALIYEMVTGQHVRMDYFSHWKEGLPYTPRWPQRDVLPATDGVWLGHIIEKCWTEGIMNTAQDLVTLLEHETSPI